MSKETFNSIMNKTIHTLDETSMNNVSEMWLFIEEQQKKIDELEADNIRLCEIIKQQQRASFWAFKIDDLEARLAKVVESLGFYGDGCNWDIEVDYYGEDVAPPISCDGGKLARKTLEEIEKGE